MKPFKPSLKTLENSKEFKDWKKENTDTYLSYGFLMPTSSKDWKIGYYHKKDNKITSFNVGEMITTEPESEIFKKDETKVNKIDLKKLKFEVDKAIEIAKKFQEEKYKNDVPNKTIIILQNLEIGQIWNITYLTLTLKSLNIKINTENEKVLEHKSTSLFRSQFALHHPATFHQDRIQLI